MNRLLKFIYYYIKIKKSQNITAKDSNLDEWNKSVENMNVIQKKKKMKDI